MSLLSFNQDGSGNLQVIAAGSDYPPYRSVEKYNVLEDSWTLGNFLPYEVTTADSVPYEDTFALVGGHMCLDSLCYDSDDILLYKPTNDSWVVMEGALKTQLSYPTAITVKRSIFPACPGKYIVIEEYYTFF